MGNSLPSSTVEYNNSQDEEADQNKTKFSDEQSNGENEDGKTVGSNKNVILLSNDFVEYFGVSPNSAQHEHEFQQNYPSVTPLLPLPRQYGIYEETNNVGDNESSGSLKLEDQTVKSYEESEDENGIKRIFVDEEEAFDKDEQKKIENTGGADYKSAILEEEKRSNNNTDENKVKLEESKIKVQQSENSKKSELTTQSSGLKNNRILVNDDLQQEDHSVIGIEKQPISRLLQKLHNEEQCALQDKFVNLEEMLNADEECKEFESIVPSYPCKREESNLLSCLSKWHDQPLSCSRFVDSYLHCARQLMTQP